MAKKQKYFRQVEKMLYDYKYLDQAIANLEAELEAIMPQTSYQRDLLIQAYKAALAEGLSVDEAVANVCRYLPGDGAGSAS